MRRIESTHSIWLFDEERMVYCRLPKGVDTSSLPPERDWQPYFGIELERSGAFTVALNPDRTKMMRAWREPAHPTTELELPPQA